MHTSDRGHIRMAKSWAMIKESRHLALLPLTRPRPQHPEGNMTVSKTRSFVAERQLAIARRLFRAMVAKDPDRSITLCDSRGEVVARHDPRPEQTALDLPARQAPNEKSPRGFWLGPRRD